jgi:ribosome-associated protein
MKSLDKAMLAADIIMERKAVDPVLFNIGGMTSFADYFLIAGGNSTRQVQSIGRHLIEKMREHGFKAYGTEGENEGQWILMDYGDLVIHLFYEPVRAFYDLEGLWMEAPRIEIKNNGPKKEKK